jgi:hypothetical protein
LDRCTRVHTTDGMANYHWRNGSKTLPLAEYSASGAPFNPLHDLCHV